MIIKVTHLQIAPIIDILTHEFVVGLVDRLAQELASRGETEHLHVELLIHLLSFFFTDFCLNTQNYGVREMGADLSGNCLGEGGYLVLDLGHWGFVETYYLGIPIT